MTSDDIEHALAYGFSKDQRWKGFSYPIRRTQLDEILVAGKVSIVRNVYFSSPHGRMVECFFNFHEWRQDYAISLRIHQVPSPERITSENLLIGIILPHFCRWAYRLELLTLDPRSTFPQRVYVDYSLQDETVRVAESPNLDTGKEVVSILTPSS